MNKMAKVTGDNKPLSMKVPTQAQLDKWVTEALDLFRNEHSTGRRFTAWEVCLHIIATHGGEYVIPHASRQAFEGVRDMVRRLMETLKDDPAKPYYAADDVAADGESAIFWTPIQPPPQIPSTTQVTISVANPDGNTGDGSTANSPLLPTTISYKIKGFNFTDTL